VERKLAAEMSVSVTAPLVRVPDAIVREGLAQADLRKPVASVHEEEEEEEAESARGEISDEDHNFVGPWVAKGNPTAFLDSIVLDQCGHDWRERRVKAMKKWEWKFVAECLLMFTVNFVESELVETDEDIKRFDLMIRILGEDGSVDGEGLQRIADAFTKLERQMGKFYQQQDDADDNLKARDGIIAGLREQLAQLSDRKDSSELEKQLADQTHSIAKFAENGVWLQEKLKAAERKAEEAEEKEGEKWKAWAEKEVQVKTGKAVSAERKKWQAKGKALPIETVTTPPRPTISRNRRWYRWMMAHRRSWRRGRGEPRAVRIRGSDSGTSGYKKKTGFSTFGSKTGWEAISTSQTPPRSALPDENGPLVKAMVIHGVPCQRPMADTIQEVGVNGIMGARWLLGGMRRLGKATSSVVVFFDRKLALGSHLKVRGW